MTLSLWCFSQKRKSIENSVPQHRSTLDTIYFLLCLKYGIQVVNINYSIIIVQFYARDITLKSMFSQWTRQTSFLMSFSS